MQKGRFFTKEEHQRIRCVLCPHQCTLKKGTVGICKVRQGGDETIELPYYGGVSSLAVDPIEKKPLYHFRPGTSIFSVGFVGCNLRCPFCQNWEISQETEIPLRFLSPIQLCEKAEESSTGAIAYTYSEPLVHAEYLLDSMTEAHRRGLANVLVTNGCIQEEPAQEILSLVDATNVDLKSFSSDTYTTILGGNLEAVRRFITLAHGMGIHTEITTLVVPGINDTEEELLAIAEWIAQLSPHIPWHLSAYHPAYRYQAPPTSGTFLFSIATRAQKILRYVYVGNLWANSNNTRCPVCGALVIERHNYHTRLVALEKIPPADGKEGSHGSYRCASCKAPLPIYY